MVYVFTLEPLFTFNGDLVGTKTSNVGPHFVDEFTEGGDVGFTSGVVDDGDAGKTGGEHYNVFGGGNRGFIKENVARLGLFEFKFKSVVLNGDFGAKSLKSVNMGTDAAFTNLVATRENEFGLAEAS